MNDFYSNFEIRQCVTIWRMTLNQALTDALNGNRIEKRSAIRWFFNDDRDFYFVCDCARVSPHKIRSFLINEFAIRDPDIIKNTLYEEPKRGHFPPITLPHKSIPKIKADSPISFIYEGMEIRAQVIDEELWFNLSQLNFFWKFCETHDVALRDINTCIDPIHLKKLDVKKLVLFVDSTGIAQIAESLKVSNLKSFATWINQKKYKQNILKVLDTFEIKFQDCTVLAILFKGKLFLRFNDVSKIFLIVTPSHRKTILKKNKYFYSYLNSQKRQLMTRSDLLIQVIESRKIASKKYKKMRPKIVQWIKEQQQLFEGKTNDK